MDPAPGSAVSVGPLSAPPGRRRVRRAAWRIGAGVLLVAGTFGGGVVVGWVASDSSASRRVSPTPEVVTVPAVTFGADAEVLMPDVRGLDQDTARQALADAGITADRITTTTQQAAGAAGRVVEQTPTFGTSDPAAVTLVVSVAATVPDAVGRQAEAVTQELGRLGAAVETTWVYEAGADAGSILAIDPAPGAPLPESLTLTVAEPAVSVHLSALRTVDSSCSTWEGSVDGRQVGTALSCRGSSDGQEYAWVIARVVDRIQGTVGIADDADPASKVRVVVTADGRKVAEETVSYGRPAAIDVKVTGVLRLSVTVEDLSPEDTPTAEAILADWELIGGESALGALSPEEQ